MQKRCICLVLLTVMATTALNDSKYEDKQLETDEIINYVNKINTTWKAGRNFHPSLTKRYSKVLLGLRRLTDLSLPVLEDDDDDEVIDLPESFDAREKWRNCTALQTVRDQAECGSCWAVSSASVFTDRLCIASKGLFNSQLSAQYLMSCCQECSCFADAYKCSGGSDFEAFNYFEKKGIVSGGDYNSEEGCQPYALAHCDHHVTGKYINCSLQINPPQICLSTCNNTKFKGSFEKDLHFIKEGSSFTIEGDVKQMQKEIYKNGPLVAGFGVYEDFISYKSGVYQHHTGEFDGGHAVKVIGWGVEDGTPYWLVANSWNEDWGDQGFFKIRRGTNECGFEGSMTGGVPDLSHL